MRSSAALRVELEGCGSGVPPFDSIRGPEMKICKTSTLALPWYQRFPVFNPACFVYRERIGPRVGPARFGLATFRLSAGRSNQAKLRARGVAKAGDPT